VHFGKPDQRPLEAGTLEDGAMDLFVTAAERKAAAPDVKALHAKIGQLAMEHDLLAGALGRIPDASAKR